MLTKSSCEVATNLALMLFEQTKNLTPAAGSLMAELSTSAYVPIPADQAKDFDLAHLPGYMISTSDGSTVPTGPKGQNTYIQSKHDGFMDNYIDTLTKLVTSHLQFARSTVYPKVQLLQQEIEAVLESHRVKQPEDFFEITMYAPPEVIECELIAEEVLAYENTTAIKTAHVINFGDTGGEIIADIKAYVTSGEGDSDRAVAAWIDSIDPGVLRGYLFSAIDQLPAAMSLKTTIEYSLINFLFYRSLAIRADLSVGLSSGQLLARAADNRDFYAQMLKATIETYKANIKQGVLIDPSSDFNFSYLSNKRFALVLYTDSFAAAQEQGATLEQVFGYIAAYGNAQLTAEMLKSEGGQFAARWNSVRALYLSHIMSERDVVAKMALKMKSVEVICKDAEAEEGLARTQSFQEETAKLITRYVDELDAACLDKLYQVCIDVVAGIGYRDTASARIINEMVSLMVKDDSIDASQAALISVVKYLSDFLIEEIDVA